MKKIAICIFAVLIGFIEIFAQINPTGTPQIITYKPEEYKAAPQHLAVVQNINGIMYFGNYGHILEYDGASWRKIQLGKEYTVTALATDSLGHVYVSAGNEFGYLSSTTTGKLIYISLSEKIEQEQLKHSETGNCFVAYDGIYFQSPTAMYHYPIVSGELLGTEPTIWKAETEFTNSYIVNREKVFVHQKNIGLMQLVRENNGFIELKNGENFIDRKTIAILPYNRKDLLICTEKDGMFYYVHGSGFGKFRSESNEYLDQISSLSAIALSENHYILSTINKGTMLIYKAGVKTTGRITEQFNRAAGLPSEKITSLYNNPLYNDNLLWLTSFYGISRVNVHSPLKELTPATALRDIVFDMIKYNDKLFVSTLGEIYYLEKNEENNSYYFEKINNLYSGSGYSWTQMPITITSTKTVKKTVKEKWYKKGKQVTRKITDKRQENAILVGNQEGLHYILNNEALQINNEYKINTLYPSREDSSRLYLGLNDGFAIMSYQNGEWLNEGKMPRITENITSIVEAHDKSLWLGINGGELIHIQFTGEKYTSQTNKRNNWISVSKEIRIDKYGQAANLPPLEENSLYLVDNKILISTNKGLFQYDNDKDVFVAKNPFNETLSNGKIRILQLVEDLSGNFWIRTQNAYTNEIKFFRKEASERYIQDNDIIRLLPDMTIQTIFPENDSLVWISGSEGLFSYDLKLGKKIKDVPFNTLVRKVMLDNDSVLYWGNTAGESTEIIQLNYKMNDLRFFFAAPYFDNEKSMRFSFCLEGFENQWSEWTKQNMKEYTNLPQGNYKFKVKAKNLFGNESEVAEYEFIILPAWYQATWVLITAILLLIFVVLFIIRLNSKRLRRQNEELEKIIKERTVEIRAQRDDIEKQHKKLEEQNAVLEKQKNELEAQKLEITEKNEELIQQKEEIQTTAEKLQETNEALGLKNIELEQKNEEINRNQQQLIQQEKLASLGQLTAGIAHEIRNPLNFINNFSETSIELIEQDIMEVLEEEKPNITTEGYEELTEVLEMVKSNAKKINEHGNRAERIVKGMLQHSRGASGEMENIDVNQLVEEYVQLAFHGVRAKDKEFNTKITYLLDPKIGKIKLAPQEFSRMILNIVNNACYAVNEKQKTAENYSPEIIIKTQKVESDFILTIRDNGIGMPDEVRTKIFNPFFTTKPTGQGTGLGLSMTHDIITQLHKGKIEVETKAGEFTEFLITIPDLN